MRGNPTVRQVALTFDDGPHPEYTPKLLAILKKDDVPATFFLVGEMAEKYPNLVRAEADGPLPVADGHSIGNHTYHHVSLIKILR
jgi:peptidoglycan/xylan/chitin deacetylase (PgdA/CDA1 family)